MQKSPRKKRKLSTKRERERKNRNAIQKLRIDPELVKEVRKKYAKRN